MHISFIQNPCNVGMLPAHQTLSLSFQEMFCFFVVVVLIGKFDDPALECRRLYSCIEKGCLVEGAKALYKCSGEIKREPQLGHDAYVRVQAHTYLIVHFAFFYLQVES